MKKLFLLITLVCCWASIQAQSQPIQTSNLSANASDWTWSRSDMNQDHFAIVYSNKNDNQNSTEGVFLKTYPVSDPTASISSQIQVSSISDVGNSIEVEMDDSNNVYVLYRDKPNQGPTVTMLKKYDVNGTPLGSVQVASYTGGLGGEKGMDLALTPDGDVMVTFTSHNPNKILMKFYNSNLTFLGDKDILNTSSSSFLAAFIDSNGNDFVLGLNHLGPGNQTTVTIKRYNYVNSFPSGINASTLTSTFAETISNESIYHYSNNIALRSNGDVFYAITTGSGLTDNKIKKLPGGSSSSVLFNGNAAFVKADVNDNIAISKLTGNVHLHDANDAYLQLYVVGNDINKRINSLSINDCNILVTGIDTFINVQDPGAYDNSFETFHQLFSTIQIDLPDSIIICDGNFDALCGPTAPSGISYEYLWFLDNQLLNLPPDSDCYTPTEYGTYTLTVNASNGCSESHDVVIGGIPQPDLGGDIEIPCYEHMTDTINLIGQGFDDPAFTIVWYHNNNEVQQGGETLMMSIEEGTITVVISYDGCESVSDTITITQQDPCCPEDLELVFDCHTGEISIQNLPTDITIDTIFWELDSAMIPGANDTSLQITSPGTYSLGIIFILPNGVECHHFIHLTVTEDDCPNTIFCPEDIALAMNCETGELYIENLPSDISINTIFWELNGDMVSGATDTTLQVTEEGTYSLGIIFTLSTGVECHHFIHFEYHEEMCCEETGPNPIATILNDDGTYFLEETKYGPMTVPVVDCRLRIDGSLTTCEDSYQITIVPYDPVSWTPTGPPAYNEVFSGQAPGFIEFPPGTFPPQSNGQFYHVTFYAGSPMTPTYLAFWYTCQQEIQDKARNIEFQNVGQEFITLYPNPASDMVNLNTPFNSGSYQVSNIEGRIIEKGTLESNNTTLDFSNLNTGLYIVQIKNSNGEVFYKKVIKE